MQCKELGLGEESAKHRHHRLYNGEMMCNVVCVTMRICFLAVDAKDRRGVSGGPWHLCHEPRREKEKEPEGSGQSREEDIAAGGPVRASTSL